MEKYKSHLDTECPVVPAQLLNNAGIIGAASLAAAETNSSF